MTKVNPEQAARCVALCLQANLPVAIWSEPGAGKSSIIAKIARCLQWLLFDVRLSDKEPSDFALPYPVKGVLTYLMSKLLPWTVEKPCILFLDEFDRASMAVQNMALQLILDRSICGQKLPEDVRVVMAGNQASDIGTNQLSEAAATRMVHIYLETQSEGALDSWLKWAEDEEVSPALRSFAKFRNDVWAGKDRTDLVEYAKPTKRTWVMADELYKVSKSTNLKTEDIMRPLVEGCVGSAGANEFLGWIRICDQAPTVEEILADPRKARLPQDVGVTYALSLHLVREAKADESRCEAFLEYALRWGQEQASYFARTLSKAVPSCQASVAFQKWEKSRLN